MEKQKKKTRSRLGTACKVISAIYMVIYGLMWMYTLNTVMNFETTLIWGTFLQLITIVIPGLILWALGALLDRQAEDRETLAEIKALLGGTEDKEGTEEDEDLTELEARLETALEETPGDGELEQEAPRDGTEDEP